MSVTVTLEYNSIEEALNDITILKSSGRSSNIIVSSLNPVVGWVKNKVGKGIIHLRKGCYGAEEDINLLDLIGLVDWDYCKQCIRQTEPLVSASAYRPTSNISASNISASAYRPPRQASARKSSKTKGYHQVSKGGVGVCGRRTKSGKPCQNPHGLQGGPCHLHYFGNVM